MVLYFGWDARIFDTSRTYLVRVDNDGFLDYATNSEGFKNAVDNEFPLMNLKLLESE
jgi:hypothetical protein